MQEFLDFLRSFFEENVENQGNMQEINVFISYGDENGDNHVINLDEIRAEDLNLAQDLNLADFGALQIYVPAETIELIRDSMAEFCDIFRFNPEILPNLIRPRSSVNSPVLRRDFNEFSQRASCNLM